MSGNEYVEISDSDGDNGSVINLDSDTPMEESNVVNMISDDDVDVYMYSDPTTPQNNANVNALLSPPLAQSSNSNPLTASLNAGKQSSTASASASTNRVPPRKSTQPSKRQRSPKETPSDPHPKKKPRKAPAMTQKAKKEYAEALANSRYIQQQPSDAFDKTNLKADYSNLLEFMDPYLDAAADVLRADNAAAAKKANSAARRKAKQQPTNPPEDDPSADVDKPDLDKTLEVTMVSVYNMLFDYILEGVYWTESRGNDFTQPVTQPALALANQRAVHRTNNPEMSDDALRSRIVQYLETPDPTYDKMSVDEYFENIALEKLSLIKAKNFDDYMEQLPHMKRRREEQAKLPFLHQYITYENVHKMISAIHAGQHQDEFGADVINDQKQTFMGFSGFHNTTFVSQADFSHVFMPHLYYMPLLLNVQARMNFECRHRYVPKLIKTMALNNSEASQELASKHWSMIPLPMVYVRMQQGVNNDMYSTETANDMSRVVDELRKVVVGGNSVGGDALKTKRRHVPVVLRGWLNLSVTTDQELTILNGDNATGAFVAGAGDTTILVLMPGQMVVFDARRTLWVRPVYLNTAMSSTSHVDSESLVPNRPENIQILDGLSAAATCLWVAWSKEKDYLKVWKYVKDYKAPVHAILPIATFEDYGRTNPPSVTKVTDFKDENELIAKHKANLSFMENAIYKSWQPSYYNGDYIVPQYDAVPPYEAVPVPHTDEPKARPSRSQFGYLSGNMQLAELSEFIQSKTMPAWCRRFSEETWPTDVTYGITALNEEHAPTHTPPHNTLMVAAAEATRVLIQKSYDLKATPVKWHFVSNGRVTINEIQKKKVYVNKDRKQLKNIKTYIGIVPINNSVMSVTLVTPQSNQTRVVHITRQRFLVFDQTSLSVVVQKLTNSTVNPIFYTFTVMEVVDGVTRNSVVQGTTAPDAFQKNFTTVRNFGMLSGNENVHKFIWLPDLAEPHLELNPLTATETFISDEFLPKLTDGTDKPGHPGLTRRVEMKKKRDKSILKFKPEDRAEMANKLNEWRTMQTLAQNPPPPGPLPPYVPFVPTETQASSSSGAASNQERKEADNIDKADAEEMLKDDDALHLLFGDEEHDYTITDGQLYPKQ